MPYFIRDGKIQTEGLQLAGAYHCNLRCADCLSISSCAPAGFPSLESVEADLGRLGAVAHAKELRIVGGEPLLNPKLGELAGIAKRSQIADKVTMFTNGRFFERMNETVWSNLDQLNISVYPEAPPPEGALEEAAAQTQARGIELRVYRRHRFYVRVVTQPHPEDFVTRLIFFACSAAHQDHCHWVHEGRLFKCAMPLFLPGYLRKLGWDDYVAADDGMEIGREGDLSGRLRSFLGSTNVLQACRWCLGSFGRREAHRQLTREELDDPGLRPVTRGTRLSPTRLVLRTANQLRHSTVGRILGGFG